MAKKLIIGKTYMKFAAVAMATSKSDKNKIDISKFLLRKNEKLLKLSTS